MNFCKVTAHIYAPIRCEYYLCLDVIRNSLVIIRCGVTILSCTEEFASCNKIYTLLKGERKLMWEKCRPWLLMISVYKQPSNTVSVLYLTLVALLLKLLSFNISKTSKN